MQRIIQYIQQTPLYVLGFLLFWEWLRPLEIVTDTADAEWFLIFAIVSFGLYFLQVHVLIGGVLRLLTLLFILNVLFYKGGFWEFNWLNGLFADLQQNFDLLLNMQWWGITNVFRTFLFLVLLWLMSYLTYYWLIQAKKIFLFFLLTVLYLGVLDTFTSYDGDVAIVRTLIIGLLVMGILYMLRIKEEEQVKIPIFWIIPLIIIGSSAIGFALFMPKVAPQWPDPVPFIQKATSEGFGNGPEAIKKIGYGTNDEQLGGPFIMDNSTVFTAQVGEQHYWRVESKDSYTGKGWTVSEEVDLQQVDSQIVGVGQVNSAVFVKEYSAKIKIDPSISYPHIVYAPELRSVEADREVDYFVNPLTEKVFTQKGGKPYSLGEYELFYDYPEYKIEELENAEGSHPSDSYIQLPDNLPQRVYDLALDITKNEQTTYDKVKAVEQYFSRNGFVYETKDVAIPDETQDYVDQFLFDTKRGYCDNYSSSMAVLLRAVGIPTRWVKGYTQGDFIENINSEERIYKITNANAHSWVEVYFPNNGWVPFEPTKGFDNPYAFAEEQQLTDEETEIPQQEEEIEQQEQTEEQDKQTLGVTVPLKFLLLVLVFLLLVGLVVFLTRRKWMKILLLKKYRQFTEVEQFTDAYLELLKQLERYGMNRRQGQTLRDYSRDIDRRLQSSNMSELTKYYEQFTYGAQFEISVLSKVYELWENSIKEISS
ncbi:transglutaminase TgpA family protein [Bacillus solimangrovi]|uniref:Transglutaminase-like domain-containing protein n=1 Tax=Bacillus solimangrovi TaxID=1305675 RepID=A0A1E5LD24_9BACI|nr:transglutaminase domain-containing protein [Bacillus solimangrovi]OEH91976.1 hypothetical protein BFG57_17405 [Bacillus solimangrovi]